ncbi:MAG TPA: cytochrome c [bacterium]|jgi:thiosulfate dehydrogenase|nr:cytochrome c [bacterium]
MARGIFLGILLTLLLGLVGAYIFVVTGGMPANADSKPSALETWAAHTSLRASLEREAPKGPDPVELSDRNLTAGLHLYAKNCMVCHGASDGQASAIAAGLYQEPPQFAMDGVEDDPEGLSYWKIKHGIRLTGMPSYSASLDDTQIWQLALFLKHMDSLPPSVQRVWKTLPAQ